MITSESRFGPQIARLCDDQNAGYDNPAVKDLLASPHLWSFYFNLPPGQMFVLPAGVDTSTTIQVVANHGAWITECPFCHSSQFACRADPFFFCAACTNATNDHRSVPTVWPGNWADIERVLELRPFISNRNWDPSETIDDLVADNRDHGLAA